MQMHFRYRRGAILTPQALPVNIFVVFNLLMENVVSSDCHLSCISLYTHICIHIYEHIIVMIIGLLVKKGNIKDESLSLFKKHISST